MNKLCSKFATMFLAIVMIVSLFVAPVSFASDFANEITGFIWDVNSITGVKFSKSYADASDIQVILGIYEGNELMDIRSATVQNGASKALFDTAVCVEAGQNAKAFLWTVSSINPLSECYPVTHSGEVYSSCEVKGQAVVVLPADNADFNTKVSYSLYDSEIEDNVDAEFSVTGADLTGISMSDDGTLKMSPQANPGKIFVNAQYGCNVYQKEITLVDGYYEDFESYANSDTRNITEGSKATAGHWQGIRAGTISSEANGNIYLDTVLDSQKYARYYPIENYASENIIFECDIKPEASNTYFMRPYTATSGGKELFTLLYNAKDGNKIGYKIGNDGISCTTAYFEQSFIDSEWNNLKFELDLVSGVYSVTVNNEKIITDWKMNANATEPMIAMIDFYSDVDNIKIYSGKAYKPYEIDGLDDIVLPGTSAKFTTSVNYALKDVDTGVVATGVTYTLSESKTGISISANGILTATQEAEAGTISIVATKDGISYEKDINMRKGYSDDFESYDIGTCPNTYGVGRDDCVKIDQIGSNKYMNRTYSYYRYITDNNGLAADEVTIEYDVLLSGEYDDSYIGSFVEEHADRSDLKLAYITYTGGDSDVNIRTAVNKEGSQVTSGNIVAKRKDGDTFRVKYILNYKEGTFDMYVDDVLVADDYVFPASENKLLYMYFMTSIDNIDVYTGTKN